VFSGFPSFFLIEKSVQERVKDKVSGYKNPHFFVSSVVASVNVRPSNLLEAHFKLQTDGRALVVVLLHRDGLPSNPHGFSEEYHPLHCCNSSREHTLRGLLMIA